MFDHDGERVHVTAQPVALVDEAYIRGVEDLATRKQQAFECAQARHAVLRWGGNWEWDGKTPCPTNTGKDNYERA
jgi:hypothetical protein